MCSDEREVKIRFLGGSLKINMEKRVMIVPCGDYDEANVRPALIELLNKARLEIRPGMKIGIKANLVTFLKPQTAGVTHFSLILELSRLLLELGAKVVVGDSPGGPFTKPALAAVYKATAMTRIEEIGGSLNYNTDIAHAEFPKAATISHFTYTAWLDEMDAVINFCKLKTHGMLGLSCAVKNLFGIVPGLTKPEYHYLYPDQRDFGNMLIDLNEFMKPKMLLNICDAVVGMEGNGPTSGSPRYVGCLMASKSPYALDIAAASMINLTHDESVTLPLSIERGLAPKSVEELEIDGDISKYFVGDYKKQPAHGTAFGGSGFFGKAVKTLLSPNPRLTPELCIGCGKCAEICPAKVITMKDMHPRIDRKHCIRCFCCQEFCPKGALRAKRSAVAHLFIREK